MLLNQLMKMKVIDLYYKQKVVEEIVAYADNVPFLYIKPLTQFGKYKVVKATKWYSFDTEKWTYCWHKCKVIKAPVG